MSKTITAKTIRSFKSKTSSASIAAKAAEFLMWAHDRYPGQYVPWNYVFLGATGCRASLKSKQVENLRKRASDIRNVIFRNNPGKELIVDRNLGARVTIDADEFVHYGVKKRGRVVNMSMIKLRAYADVTDVKKLKKKDNKEYFAGLLPVLKRLSPGYQARLLPPADQEKKDQ